MSRWVVPQRPGLKAEGKDDPDSPLSRVVKYIPTEIVSAYTIIFSSLVMLRLPPGQAKYGVLALMLMFLITTVVYVAKQTGGVVRRAHLIVSPVAFLAWSYPISSALLGELFLGAVALGLQAIVIALSIVIVPREPERSV
ncbi:hypothetical protein [Rhodopseudomonas palustris]|nr:hypothetical protein [Rhodopseudomonas palustris]QQM04933.1 hypothetical protein I8G32_03498 [Rhodopseudomonas palustris]RJF65073.1 hypothetical protein D4Q71_09795 [Rhodopseudomonas palustris]WAB76299.1 hypothetical protein OR798_17570 [Rhodopseudomonas palustris]WCL93564.1 hypothetical protein TX73_017565 [Rhodopseudomonas palustris CGA009]WND50209.1 hypothetical protein L1A21_17495 [Rhodopseudomonas palustris]